jgi:hypothetical protein
LKLKASEIEEKRLDLERQQFGLTEGKERMARYAFVQGLLPSATSEKDASQRAFAINLMNLALTEQEAAKLFTGMQASSDKRTQEAGSFGQELVAVTSLVAQLDAAAKDARLGAAENLIRNYSRDNRAVEQTIAMLEQPRVTGLSASGRINVLVYLRNTEQSAWTPALRTRAQQAFAGMRSQHAVKALELGQQGLDALGQAERHVAGLPRK